MPDKSKYRAVYVSPEIFSKLQIIKCKLKEQKKRAFGNDIIEHLLEMKSQAENLEQQYLEALNSIHKLEQQIISLVQVKNSIDYSTASNRNPVLNPPPNIPAPPTNEKIRGTASVKSTNNPKSDLIHEMNIIMQGKFMRPSEILKISQPKFASIEE